MEFLKDILQDLQGKSLTRALRVVDGAPGVFLSLKQEGSDKKFLNFSSNNYLGLAFHPRPLHAAKEALDTYGAGSTASRLISGTLEVHERLEQVLACFKNTEDSLVFPTGYMANLGTIAALSGPGDAIVMDRLNHASIVDGARLSGARLFVYGHCDMEALEKVLKRTRNYRRRLIVTDSLFSMDGDVAPLPQIVGLAKQYQAMTMIDEAHATGVFGMKGRGMAEHFHVEGKIDIIMGTLSKALGSLGGFVCGRRDLIKFLKNKARSFIYTTALAPASCGAAMEALKLVDEEPERRSHVLTLALFLRESLRRLGFDTMQSVSQIVPIRLESVERALEVSRILQNERIFAPAIRPPTVPEDQCRIRFSLTAEHTEDHVKALESTLMSVVHP